MDWNAYRGMACQIKTMDNIIMANGRIKGMGENILEIEAMNNDLPIFQYELRLKVVITPSEEKGKRQSRHSSGMIMQVGRVYGSGPALLRLSDMAEAKDAEKRRSYRVGVEIRSKMYVVDEGDRQKDELSLAMGRPVRHSWYPIQIKNLSLSGMLFECGVRLNFGQTVRINVDFFCPGVMDYTIEAKVMRVQQMADSMAYGVDFVKLTGWEEQRLCSFVFVKQRDQIRRMQGMGLVK